MTGAWLELRLFNMTLSGFDFWGSLLALGVAVDLPLVMSCCLLLLYAVLFECAFVRCVFVFWG